MDDSSTCKHRKQTDGQTDGQERSVCADMSCCCVERCVYDCRLGPPQPVHLSLTSHPLPHPLLICSALWGTGRAILSPK
ncbi:hypothetical protein INR49_017326 [Caranx melampygus]|nr:hypothetical protein INR49_017326 [Caranx melampygus]